MTTMLVACTLNNIFSFGGTGANLYPKLQFLAISGAVKAHIFKSTVVKFGMRMRTWYSYPMPNFGKTA